MNPRPTLPSTTPNPREDLHRFVNQLNVRYNVGVPIPGPHLSVLEKQADQSPASRIYRRLEIHFYSGGIEALNRLLPLFDVQAKECWSKWVRKPDADADTLPATRHPTLAANLTQRDWLQAIFNKVLDKAQPSMQPSRSFGRTQSGPAAFGGDASADKSSWSHPKRRADREMGDVAKKSRAVPDPIRDLTASSSSRRHQKVDSRASALGTMRPPKNKAGDTPIVSSNKLPRSFGSVSTGTSTASAVFSACSDVPIATQDTVEASFQEQQRPAPNYGLSPCTQDSYAPSPSLEQGLYELLDQNAPLSVEPATFKPAPRTRPGNTVYSSQSSEFTSLSSDVEREVLRRAVDWETQSKMQDYGLHSVWPLFPAWLHEAPFSVAWEVTRIAQSCDVDLTKVDLAHCPQWHKQEDFWASLWRHPAFQGKTAHEASSDAAWAAGLRAARHDQSPGLPSDKQIVYTASLDFSRKSTPLQLTLQPLKLESSHRLGRHYGADRFIELLIPSPDSSNLPAFLKNSASFSRSLIRWLIEEHAFCGRSWKAFYTKSGGSRKPVKGLQFGPDPKPVYKDRIYFFAERAEADPNMTRVRLSSMLNWALSLRQEDNGSQPVLKLFQRIALVLSRTNPAVVFEPHQMMHRKRDVLSPKGQVMNDGVARMSPAVARQIRARLGLMVTPAAVQGRLGSAKGMWILDTRISPASDKIWIETFPSQRKWVVDWSNADEHHRTLEIRNVASMPKSASFNLQFLPVIEDRAIDKVSMREAIGSLLKTKLRNELDGQRRALQTPLQFRQWTHETATHKHDRIVQERVPYLGGMPQEDEEVMNMLLDAGFDSRNELLNGITWNIQKRKCKMLMEKLNITVGRSVYLYMVVDFLGVLEENEVHVGFSTAFEADDEWSKTMLHGTDVLVARSPAHFNSDIQKVKAVFRPELADLTNVIVFSSKGDIPLAAKLSGGDYDGDLAWVCWDPRIVDNFTNAPVQEQFDLSQYMPQEKERFRDVLNKHNKSFGGAVRAMMSSAFEFNLSKSLLGGCTNYKERLCYARNNVCDKPARVLSTLLSNLVDQPKQGLRFTPSDFHRLQKDYGLPAHVDDPIYKLDHWPANMKVVHIIDFLKFLVAKPTVAEELKSFHEELKSTNACHWDKDLALRYKDYERQAQSQPQGSCATVILKHLKADIRTVQAEWDKVDDSITFTERVAYVYPLWQAIQPRAEALGGPADSKTVHELLYGGEVSNWALLRASTAFYMYCNSSGSSPRFVWQMACTQLCWMKAFAVSKRNSHGAEGAPRAVMPSIYASLRPDAKFVKQVTARTEGTSQVGLNDDCDDHVDFDD